MKYGLDAEAVTRLRSALESWADELELDARPADKWRRRRTANRAPPP